VGESSYKVTKKKGSHPSATERRRLVVRALVDKVFPGSLLSLLAKYAPAGEGKWEVLLGVLV